MTYSAAVFKQAERVHSANVIDVFDTISRLNLVQKCVRISSLVGVFLQKVKNDRSFLMIVTLS